MSLEEELVVSDTLLERTLADAELVRAEVVSLSDADFISSAPALEGRAHALLDAARSAQNVDSTLMLVLAGHSDLLLSSIATAKPVPPVDVSGGLGERGLWRRPLWR